MNEYLYHIDRSNLAVTSIGLDGEELDQVTNLEKPQILVQPGYLVATAYDTLGKYTCDYEIIKTLDITTSIGNVVIVKINSRGKALVAGPAKVTDMARLILELKNYQLDKIIIDGAFSRHVFAKITQATILVVGANYSRDIDLVVNDAVILHKKFSLKYHDLKDFCFGDKICLINDDNMMINLEYSSIIGNVDRFFNLDFRNISKVYFPKSLTNKFVERLIVERRRCKFDIIVDSPINIQVHHNLLKKLFQLENQLYVNNPLNLSLVCYNPVSPLGYEFDNEEFKKKLTMNLGREVFNVLEGERDE
jgi:hypothetical protein